MAIMRVIASTLFFSGYMQISLVSQSGSQVRDKVHASSGRNSLWNKHGKCFYKEDNAILTWF